MYIEIELPIECDTKEKKQAHIQKIYEWGLDCIIDQEAWSYLTGISMLIQNHTKVFEIEIENEIDAMAVKLTWS